MNKTNCRLLSDEEMMKALYPKWTATKKDTNIWKTEPEYKERRNQARNIAVHQDAKTYSIAFEAGKKQGMRELAEKIRSINKSGDFYYSFTEGDLENLLDR